MLNSKNIVAAGLTGALLLAGPLAAPALAVTQSDVDTASARLSELGDELARIQSDLGQATDDVETTSYQIGQKQSEVDATQADLNAKKDELSAMMRSNYKEGSSTVLDYILGSTSIDDLVSRVIYMDKVAEQRSEKIQSVKAAEEALRQEQSELEGKQSEQSEKVASLQSQADEYYARVDEAAAYFNSLDSELQQQIAAAAATEAANSSVSVAVQAIQTTPAVQETTEQASDTTSQGNSSAGASSQDTQTQQNGGSSSYSGSDSGTDSGSGSDSGPSAGSGSGSSSGSGTTNIPTGGGVATALAAAEANAPYVYGAAGPDSFDCSGLVCYSYGYARGRTTYDMISSLQSTGSWKSSMDQLSYGDLIFTSEGHVGIYLGGGQMVHAPKPGSSVCITTVWACIGGGTY